MRGSNHNLSSMVQKRKKVWADVDTRTSREGPKSMVRSRSNPSNGGGDKTRLLSPLRTEYTEEKHTTSSSKSNNNRHKQLIKQAQKRDGWQTKLWKSKWLLFAAIVTLMVLRRR